MPSDTAVWMGIVVGVALVLYAYYRALEFLEDKAEDALRSRVKSPPDIAPVSLKWRDEQSRNRRQD